MLDNHITKPTTQPINAKRHQPGVLSKSLYLWYIVKSLVYPLSLARIGFLLDRISSKIKSLLISDRFRIRSPLGLNSLLDRTPLGSSPFLFRIHSQIGPPSRIGSDCRDLHIQISYIVRVPGQPCSSTVFKSFLYPLLHSGRYLYGSICHHLIIDNVCHFHPFGRAFQPIRYRSDANGVLLIGRLHNYLTGLTSNQPIGKLRRLSHGYRG